MLQRNHISVISANTTSISMIMLNCVLLGSGVTYCWQRRIRSTLYILNSRTLTNRFNTIVRDCRHTNQGCEIRDIGTNRSNQEYRIDHLSVPPILQPSDDLCGIVRDNHRPPATTSIFSVNLSSSINASGIGSVIRVWVRSKATYYVS